MDAYNGEHKKPFELNVVSWADNPLNKGHKLWWITNKCEHQVFVEAISITAAW